MSCPKFSRTEGSRLKSDYQAVIQVEAGYLRDGSLSAAERADLDARLDALDVRVGDVGYGGNQPVLDPRTRLTNIERALASGSVSSTVASQIRVEHGDLVRLEAAYGRLSPTADERAYLERRLADLETRAGVRR